MGATAYLDVGGSTGGKGTRKQWAVSDDRDNICGALFRTLEQWEGGERVRLGYLEDLSLNLGSTMC